MKIEVIDEKEFPEKSIVVRKKVDIHKYDKIRKMFSRDGIILKIEKQSIEGTHNPMLSIKNSLGYKYQIEIREDDDYVYVKRIKKNYWW